MEHAKARQYHNQNAWKQDGYQYCGTVHPPQWCLVYGKNVVCTESKTILRQINAAAMAWLVGQENNPQHWRGGLLVYSGARRAGQKLWCIRTKYINLNGVKSVIFTKLQSRTCQWQTLIIYKVDSGASGNLIPPNFPKLSSQS